MKPTEMIDKAVNAIIRPPRRNYDINSLPLYLDAHDENTYIRHPLNFTNTRKQKLIGSMYVDSRFDLMSGGPCVVFLHGNASSQQEGQYLVPNFCPKGVAVYLFDFAGCGQSDGEYISLGYYEKIDVELLLDFLVMSFNLGPFILWGRSMGASTSLMIRHTRLAGIIVDSAYTSIKDMCAAIAKSLDLPSLLVPAVVWFLKHNVLNKAGFDMSKVSPLDSASEEGNVPLLHGHATDDEFIPIDQARTIFSAYSNRDKQFYNLTGGHNGKRDSQWIKACCLFAFEKLGVIVQNFEPSSFYGLKASNHHFESYEELVRVAQGR